MEITSLITAIVSSVKEIAQDANDNCDDSGRYYQDSLLDIQHPDLALSMDPLRPFAPKKEYARHWQSPRQWSEQLTSKSYPNLKSVCTSLTEFKCHRFHMRYIHCMDTEVYSGLSRKSIPAQPSFSYQEETYRLDA
ncbi:hypothetical protein Leryth_000460 [Lithospermum erythrorhizon]|nr:hypothetical protein Leryth_000460 [Lithospermum erythrorhizon]